MKTRFWTVGAILASLLAVGSFLALRDREPLVSTARDTLDAALQGRADTVFARLDRIEIEALGLSPRVVRRILDEYVLPEFRKCKPLGPPIVSGVAAEGYVNVEQPYLTQNGAKAGLGCYAKRTPEGISCTDFLSGLVTSTMMARHAEISDTDRHAMLLRALQADAPALEGMGLRGLWSPNSGFRSWSALETFHRSRMRPMNR